MTGFHYVYMLSDEATHTHHYVGMTEDLKARMAKHNSGQVPHTAKFAPWVLDAAIAVRNKHIAVHLEQYFKSGAGRAFANKHFFPFSTSNAISNPAVDTLSPQGTFESFGGS